jgi:hypothetical protein
MIDPFVILTPILLLGVVALLGFVGCDVVFGLKEFYDGPTNLRAVAGFDAQVTLTWDAAPDATSYEIVRKDNVSTVTIPAMGTSFTDTSVTIETKYSYTVHGFVDGRATVDSNAVTATPGPITFLQLAESPEAIVGASVATPQLPAVSPSNLIVVWVYYENAGQSVAGVSDSAGDQYVLAAAQAGAGLFATFRQEIWYKNNATGGPNLTVTANFTQPLNANAAIVAHEYHNPDPEATPETTSSASAGGSVASSGAVPVTYAKLLFGAAIFRAGGGIAGPGFTQRATTNSNVTEDRPFDATAEGTAEAIFSTNPPATLDWIAQMVAFR